MNSFFFRIAVVVVGLGCVTGGSCWTPDSGQSSRAEASKELFTLESVLAVQAKAHGCIASDEDVFPTWRSASTLSGRAGEVFGQLFACLLEAETCAEYRACTGIDVESDCDPKTFTSYCSDSHTVTQCVGASDGYGGHIQNYDCALLEPYNTQCQPRSDFGVACMGGSPGQYPDGCQGNILFLTLPGGVLTKIDCSDLDLKCIELPEHKGCSAFPELDPMVFEGSRCVGNVLVKYWANIWSPFGVRTDCAWAGPGFVCKPGEGSAACAYEPTECGSDAHWPGGGEENKHSCGICYLGKKVFEPCAIIPGSTCVEILECYPTHKAGVPDFVGDGCEAWGPRCAQEEFAR